MRRIYNLFAFLLVSLSATASADLGDNSVGMNVHDGRAPFIDACSDLGVQWVRLDGNWFQLEPSDDNYNWSNIDAAVNAASASNLNVFVTLAYTPDWVPAQPDGDAASNNNVPLSSAEWTDFVTDAVNHLRPLGVTHFGLWNEANLDHFWSGTLDEYVDLIVVPGAAAVRAACNDCVVLGPDLAHVGNADDDLEQVMTRAPIDTFDIVTHHSYNGFAELGTTAFDGDRFPEVLDMQRLPGITRRSLRQVLDTAGWSGEVWMTETGYRVENNPENNPADEADQARYYELVLDEQLKRAWYTNTFFYEIHDCGPDQPMCDIDGFGIMRATGGTPGSRSFPGDFRTKPAFDALKSYIASHPEFQGAAPAQCADGVDNDGDGFADAADLGCVDGSDADESDDPPRPRLEAMRIDNVTLDGELGEFAQNSWAEPHFRDDWRGVELNVENDMSARIAASWNGASLSLAIEVTDDVHQNEQAPENLWQSDSVQLAFDVAQSGGRGYDDVDDHEINVALSGGEVTFHRFVGPRFASDDFVAAIVRTPTTTRYEIRIPATALPAADFTEGSVIGFSFLVNDDDGEGRTGWLQWTDGIGQEKAPYYFGEIVLLPAGQTNSDMGTGSPDMGSSGDPDAGTGNPTTDMGMSNGGGADGGDEPPPGDGGANDDGGCCRVVASGSKPPIWLLALVAIAIRRRR